MGQIILLLPGKPGKDRCLIGKSELIPWWFGQCRNLFGAGKCPFSRECRIGLMMDDYLNLERENKDG